MNTPTKFIEPNEEAASRGCLLHLEAGFSLVEILMALVLVGILTAVAVPQFMNLGNDARTAVTREKLSVLKAAIVGDPRLVANGRFTSTGFEAHCQGLPTSLTDLITMPTTGTCSSVYNPYTQLGWRGPYVSTTESTWNVDAWSTAIQYFSASGTPARTLRSCGPDRTCGNSDDISITF